MNNESKNVKTTKKNRIITYEFISIMIADLAIRATTAMLNVLVPIFILDKGFSTTIAGLATTAYMLTAVFFRPVSGNLVDTRGRYIVMIVGSVVYCLATGLYLFAIPIWILLLIRVMQGFGFAFNGTALTTMATDIIPEKRMSEGLGYLGLTQTIATAFAPALALGLKHAFGYHVAFIVVFAFAILNVLSRFVLKPLDKKVRSRTEDFDPDPHIKENSAGLKKKNESFFHKLVDKDAWRPSLIMLFLMFANSGLSTFLVAYALRNGIANPGIFFTVSAVVVALARLSVGKIHEKFGTVGVLAPGLGMVFLCLTLIYVKISIPILIIAGVFYGMGFGVIRPEINTLVVLVAEKENRGMANSTLFLAMDLGNAIGAVFLGAIANYTGLRPIFGIAAAILFGILIGYLILRKRDFFRESKVA